MEKIVKIAVFKGNKIIDNLNKKVHVYLNMDKGLIKLRLCVTRKIK